MTFDDLDYVRRLAAAGVFRGPVLELGTGWGGLTAKDVVIGRGLAHVGTDMTPGPGVDVAADFEKPDDVARLAARGPYGTVLVMNVLEHTFDPIRILDAAVGLVASGGAAVVLTPAVWPLHNFPMDAWRPLPNFYEQYAARRGLRLVPDWFEYVGYGPVANFREASGGYAFPPPGRSSAGRRYGRLVHRLFNTYARGLFQPSHLAIGCVFEKAAA